MPLEARAEVKVCASLDAAFELFVQGFAQWWPRQYSWSGEHLVDIRIEPGLEGRLTETGPHGFTCDFGRVTAYGPPAGIAFLWQISPRREPVPDPSKASLVTVKFEESRGGTRVALRHTSFENHRDGARDYAAAMGSEHGWPYILSCYAHAA